MNYIKRNNLLRFEKDYYDNIRKNYEKDNVILIVKKLQNKKLIMYKDSIRKLFLK